MTSADTLLDRPSPKRVGVDLLLALAFGWFAYSMSCWFVEPVAVAKGFGEQWLGMSTDPFALSGQFPHRILAPFLAWLVGYGGEGYIAFTHGLHVVMLSTVFFVVVRLRGLYLDALMVTAAVAITAPVQLYKLHWSGYTDPICYTLFLLMIVVARNPYLFWALFLANLMNHELAAFLVPWLWYLRRRQDSRWMLDGICMGVALAIYAGFYFWVKGSVEQTYSVDYFLANPLFPGGTFAVWNLAAVHCTCTYGPVLAILAWHQHTKEQQGERWHLWLVAFGILTIFCIAFDWARHSNLIVLPLVVAGTRFLAVSNRNRLVFGGVLAVTLLLFWIVPPWSPTAWPTEEFANLPYLLKSGVVVINEGPPVTFSFGATDTWFCNWLPPIWTMLLTIHLIGITIWCAGWGWARYQNRATN
jgi:hypothetical protein